MKIYLIGFFVGVVMTLFGTYTERYRHTCPNVERIVLQYPTVEEMQEFLGVEVDGDPGTETDAAWIEYSKTKQFNQYHIENMEQATGGKP